MIKRFFFFLTTFTTFCASAQRDTIVNGIRCHLYLDNDSGTAWIQTRVIKKSGEKFRGLYCEFYKSGMPKVKGYYKSGERTGKWIGYYEDGNKLFEGYFDSGFKSDLWMTYFPGGHLSWKGSFFKDMPAGFWRYFYENGKLRSMTRYEIHTSVEKTSQGVKSKGSSLKVKSRIHYAISPCDSLVEYYQDGTLKIRILYGHHGGLNGKCEYFYASGVRNLEGMFRDGKKYGNWNYYCVDGTVAFQYNYDQDEKNTLPAENENSGVKCVYVEIQPELKWHPEQLR